MTARPADNQIMVEHRALGHLTPEMKDVLAGQEIVFVASGDRDGACQASLRLGPPGFVRILDDTTLMYPVYEADGRPAGGENLGESRRVGLLFVADGLTLQVDGRTRIIDHAAVEAFAPLLRRVAGMERFDDVVDGRGRTPARWVLIDILTARTEHLAGVYAFPGGPEAAPDAPPDDSPPDDARWPAELPATTTHAVDDDELSYLLPPAWQDA